MEKKDTGVGSRDTTDMVTGSGEPREAFVCRMCGHCCQGEGGIVMHEADQDRLARHMGLERDLFLERYAEQRNGKWYLRTRDDQFCIFFHDACVVHAAKPDVCRAWPFFRGNIIDEASWEMAQDYCPGIVRKAGHAEFARQGRCYLREKGLAKGRNGSVCNALNVDDD